jgi:hypothetical protein
MSLRIRGLVQSFFFFFTKKKRILLSYASHSARYIPIQNTPDIITSGVNHTPMDL